MAAESSSSPNFKAFCSHFFSLLPCLSKRLEKYQGCAPKPCWHKNSLNYLRPLLPTTARATPTHATPCWIKGPLKLATSQGFSWIWVNHPRTPHNALKFLVFFCPGIWLRHKPGYKAHFLGITPIPNPFASGPLPPAILADLNTISRGRKQGLWLTWQLRS